MAVLHIPRGSGGNATVETNELPLITVACLTLTRRLRILRLI